MFFLLKLVLFMYIFSVYTQNRLQTISRFRPYKRKTNCILNYIISIYKNNCTPIRFGIRKTQTQGFFWVFLGKTHLEIFFNVLSYQLRFWIGRAIPRQNLILDFQFLRKCYSGADLRFGIFENHVNLCPGIYRDKSIYKYLFYW